MSALVGRNVLALGLSRVVSGLILFLVYVRLAAYLSPEGFGKFSLVFAYYTIFLLLADFGITRFVIKKISEDRSQAPSYLAHFLGIQLISSAVIFLFFLVIPRLLHYDDLVFRAMLLSGAGLVLNSLALPFSAIIQSWQKLHVMAVINFIETVARAAWFGYAIFTGRSLLFVFWSFVAIGVLDLAMYASAASRYVRFKFQTDRALLMHLLWSGLPFAAVAGLEILASKADVVIQKLFLPYTAVGLYASAYRFLDILTFIPAVVALSLFPHFAQTADQPPEAHGGIINSFNRYLVSAALAIGVAFSFLSRHIIILMYGDEFIDATGPLQILIWGSVFTFIYAVPGVLVVARKVRQAMTILGVSTLLNILGNFLLIPRFGITASAWLTVLSYFVIAVAYFVLARRIIRFSFWPLIPGPVAAAAVMAGVLWLLRDLGLAAPLILSIAAYIAVLLVFRYFNRQDWLFLKSVLGL